MVESAQMNLLTLRDLLGQLLNRDLGHWLDVESPSASSEPHREMVMAE
jgi:hypothetical protein